MGGVRHCEQGQGYRQAEAVVFTRDKLIQLLQKKQSSLVAEFGVSAKNLPEEFRTTHLGVPWTSMVGA